MHFDIEIWKDTEGNLFLHPCRWDWVFQFQYGHTPGGSLLGGCLHLTHHWDMLSWTEILRFGWGGFSACKKLTLVAQWRNEFPFELSLMSHSFDPSRFLIDGKEKHV